MIALSKNMISGLAGAAVINAVRQLAKKIDKDAPRIDKVGDEAVSKPAHVVGLDALKGNKLFLTTLAGDVIANSIYYSLIGRGKRESLLLRGVIYGAIAGIGALALTKADGLDHQPVNKTIKTNALTVGLYILGGVATVLTRRLLSGRR